VHRHDDCDSVRPAAGGKWCCCAWAAFNCRRMPAWKLAMSAQDITRGDPQQLRFVNGVQLHEYRCQGVQIRLRVTSKNGGGDLRLCCWSRFKVPFIGPSQASASAQDCSDNCPVPPNGERCVNNILDLRRSACAELASLRYVGAAAEHRSHDVDLCSCSQDARVLVLSAKQTPTPTST
jgi:hypothetical protein